MNFKLRNDINARTALVYGGAAFLLVIVGFRSIFATLDPEHIGVMTYLSIAALILEFFLLIFYAQSIYNLGPEGGSESSVIAAGAASKMDKDSASALTNAVAGLKDELRDHNKKIETLSDGVNKLVKGSVQKEIHKEIGKILNKALDS